MCSITTKWGSPLASVCEEKKRQLRLVYDHKSPYFLHDFIYPMIRVAGRTAGDVLNDIGTMLADITDELDAMLQLERKDICFGIFQADKSQEKMSMNSYFITCPNYSIIENVTFL